MAYFCSIFPIFVAKFFFPKNPAVSCATSYGLLATCQILNITYDTIPRKCSDRQKDGRTEEQTKNRWKDGQALFHRILPANAKGPTKNTRFICLSRSRLMNSHSKFMKSFFENCSSLVNIVYVVDIQGNLYSHHYTERVYILYRIWYFLVLRLDENYIVSPRKQNVCVTLKKFVSVSQPVCLCEHNIMTLSSS